MEQQASHEDEIQRIRDGIPAFMDENLIPKWLNFVKDVVDSEDLHLNVNCETLQQNRILRVIKMNLAKKYLEMLAEIAEKKDDDYKKFYAELLRFNTSQSGEERISFEEYVDRIREGQNDTYYFTGENTTVVSSSSFRGHLSKKGYEVLYMADPVDEFAVQQPKESDGTKSKSTTKDGLDLGDQDEKKSLEELKIEPEPLARLKKETLGNNVEEEIVNDRTVDSLRAHMMSEHGLFADTERIMKAQAPRDNSRHTTSEYGGSANMKRIAQQPSGSQQQRQSTRQEREKERKKERK